LILTPPRKPRASGYARPALGHVNDNRRPPHLSGAADFSSKPQNESW
jgi:hypothetical protein